MLSHRERIGASVQSHSLRRMLFINCHTFAQTIVNPSHIKLGKLVIPIGTMTTINGLSSPNINHSSSIEICTAGDSWMYSTSHILSINS